MSGWRRWLAPTLAAVLGAGVVFWLYAPRPRPALPDGDLPARFLDSAAGFDVVAWVPHPHQNLPALERLTGVHSTAVRSALRLAALPEPALPRFGRLAVPPARSLVVASDLDGERFAAVARVHWPVAALARLAGRVTDNPWLAGGATRDGEGRRVEVAWSGNLWRVGSPVLPPDPPPAGPPSSASGDPALVFFDARRTNDPLPVGRYRLAYDEETGTLVLETVAAVRGSVAPPAGIDAAGALLVALEHRPRGSSQALALFSQDPSDLAEMPHTAVLVADESRGRWKLPTESLLEIAGRSLRRADVAGLGVVAGDGASLAAARRLAPGVAERLGAERDVGSGDVFALFLELAPAAVEIGRIRRGLERSPLVAPAELARWREAERLTTALAARHRRVGLRIDSASRDAGEARPAAFGLRLEGDPDRRSLD